MSQITREKMLELEHLLQGDRAALATAVGGLRQAREVFEQAVTAFGVEQRAIDKKLGEHEDVDLSVADAIERMTDIIAFQHENTRTIWRRLMWVLRGNIEYRSRNSVGRMASGTTVAGTDLDAARLVDTNAKT